MMTPIPSWEISPPFQQAAMREDSTPTVADWGPSSSGERRENTRIQKTPRRKNPE
jgi:hypothetical protein